MSKTFLSPKLTWWGVKKTPLGESPIYTGIFDQVKITGSTKDEQVPIQVKIEGTTYTLNMLSGDVVEGPFESVRIMLGGPLSVLQAIIYERSSIEED